VVNRALAHTTIKDLIESELQPEPELVRLSEFRNVT
jgi:hypothetical protein